MTPVGTSGERGGVLLTGLAIIEALSDRQPLSITQLAIEVNGDKGNIHRIARVLHQAGYVDQDPVTKQYSLSPRIVQLAGRALHALDIRVVSNPYLEALARRTGESVHLAVKTRRGAMYVSQIRASNRLGVETDIGESPIIHCTSTGKSLYAFASEDDLRDALEEPLTRYTPKTITSVEMLKKDLARTRVQGYAVDDEELTDGVRCVASAVFDAQGTVVGAIGISGPVSRISLSRLLELGEEVRETALQVTQQLGGKLSVESATVS